MVRRTNNPKSQSLQRIQRSTLDKTRRLRRNKPHKNMRSIPIPRTKTRLNSNRTKNPRTSKTNLRRNRRIQKKLQRKLVQNCLRRPQKRLRRPPRKRKSLRIKNTRINQSAPFIRKRRPRPKGNHTPKRIPKKLVFPRKITFIIRVFKANAELLLKNRAFLLPILRRTTKKLSNRRPGPQRLLRNTL